MSGVTFVPLLTSLELPWELPSQGTLMPWATKLHGCQWSVTSDMPSTSRGIRKSSSIVHITPNLRSTEAEKMARMWFGEIPSCCCLTSLPKPAWVLLKCVLQTIFAGPVGCWPFSFHKVFGDSRQPSQNDGLSFFCLCVCLPWMPKRSTKRTPTILP